jgi:hypothetical protein
VSPDVQRPILVLALAAATALVAVTPGLNAPMARLAAYDADSRDPITTVPVDVDALRRAAELLPDDATYGLVVLDETSGQLTHDVEGVARLLFLPALLVDDPADAGWILRYGDAPLPRGVRPLERIRVGSEVTLVRVRR